MMDIVAISGRPKTTLVQKVLDVDKVKPEKLKFPMLFSEKVDGVYCLALKYNGSVTIYSRTGEVYMSMKHIETQLNSVMDNEDIIIFEAYEKGVVQSVISGHCRDTKGQHLELTAYCHQYLTMAEFIHGGTMTAQESYDHLCKFGIKVISQQPVDSLEQAVAWTKEIWDNGGEGSILRNPQAVFEGGKRNANVLRIKQGESHDLLCTGTYEGTGKYVGMLGGILCRFKDGIEIKVGTGFSDGERHLYYGACQGNIVGHICQIDAMRGSSKGKLREPRFKGIKWDKEVADF